MRKSARWRPRGCMLLQSRGACRAGSRGVLPDAPDLSALSSRELGEIGGRKCAFGCNGDTTSEVTGDVWNLVAAMLCTIAPAACSPIVFGVAMRTPTPGNRVTAVASLIATLGGIAWIMGAAMTL